MTKPTMPLIAPNPVPLPNRGRRRVIRAVLTRAVVPGTGILFAGLSMLAGGALVACNNKSPHGNASSTESGTVPRTAELPALALRDDTKDLLLTWLDPEGDFHVVQSPSEVPEAGRAQVRVVVTTQEAGTGELVYVANLTSKNPDGTYPVKTLSRLEWNNLGADRRKVRLEALAPRAETTETPAAKGASPGAEAKSDYSKVRVVIYGASWCKPCHDAEKFLRGLGADVTKKDIEESRSAQAEMQEKLAKAGRMGSSIPVIDVAGTLLVGFSEDALRSALNNAVRAETL